MKKLTEMETVALTRARDGLLLSQVPDKTYRDFLDTAVPGLPVYRKLDKAGLLIITEEDPVMFPGWDEPFTFTPQIDITEAGREALKTGFRPE